jgi:chromosomal replication initiator protein
MIKAEQLQIKLPTDVVSYIASHEEDTRALVGKLVTLSAMARDRGVEISLDLAKDVIKFGDVKSSKNTPPTPDSIINKVSLHYNQSVPAVLGKSRVSTLALPRHISMYFLKEVINMNLVEIGKRFSNRDHTSVIHAIKKVDQLIETDPKILEDVSKLRAEFQM